MMETLEKALPFVLTSLITFLVSQSFNFVKEFIYSWQEKIKENTKLGMKVDAAHKRLDELNEQVQAIGKIQTIQLNDLSHYIINKKTGGESK